MICPPHPPAQLVQGWMARHQDPTSFVLHMIGIPLTILGILMIPIYTYLFSLPVFLFSVVLFVGGYMIQFLGHALEGTDPGEVILLKRKLGWSYVDVAPPRKPRQGAARSI
ncbi:Mpo1-like protein [Singulisphaera acidiphila]|uniref:DUF962 domain-containing protein n=1 Tax=Singulisphaera acidiphila (strain ATCC BAA-1392 / DSM 18658 / VKM B-2454 / MOB10) TaxID=886293 RepID=L0DEV9_SINAD|nr:Mpo1-like protein [Singulisphaera acidiphila]AGA27370.1 Protein of unknown function (DUF962) [Singulisphaera acidiphila DSM 18658]